RADAGRCAAAGVLPARRRDPRARRRIRRGGAGPRRPRPAGAVLGAGAAGAGHRSRGRRLRSTRRRGAPRGAAGAAHSHDQALGRARRSRRADERGRAAGRGALGCGAMASGLKLGLNTGYWAGGPPPGVTESIAEAERLGFDSIWTAEAYGSDCLTPLAWWGASTTRLKLGTAIVQISARQPAATAMAAMTMDHLSGGRFILGLGVSGPQVVEGWYGMPFAKPLARTREYIGILREVWARRGPVENHGSHYPLPRPDGTGLGKPLKSSIHPLREDIPI